MPELLKADAVLLCDISGVAHSVRRSYLDLIGTLTLVDPRDQRRDLCIARGGVHLVESHSELVHMCIENRPRSETPKSAHNVLRDIQALRKRGRGERLVEEQNAPVSRGGKDFADSLGFLAESAEINGLVLIGREVREDIVARRRTERPAAAVENLGTGHRQTRVHDFGAEISPSDIEKQLGNESGQAVAVDVDIARERAVEVLYSRAEHIGHSAAEVLHQRIVLRRAAARVDLCQAVDRSAVHHRSDLGKEFDELDEHARVVEALMVDGHYADLYGTEHAVEVHAEGNALYLRGLGEQSLDISAEILKAAAVID